MSSDKGKEYYPNNKAYKFNSHLNAPLILNGVWRVALVEADITSTISKVDPIYLYSNICGESIIDGEQKPLLRRITAADLGKSGHNSYLKNKVGKQIGGGSLSGSPRSFITPIGPTVKPSEEEKVIVKLMSPVQQTEDMARDMVQREKKSIKRKRSSSNLSSTKRRHTSKTHTKSKKKQI
ncbi:unnamed protein product [Mytilus coruscus]|uniref:Uncharacterized protein n=1 Tax=Mytilus coruscus TaxID=42192 RepID=A0A6J8BKX7_MYTCO|nr:unnamed protein product [Mytilus coruscus]